MIIHFLCIFIRIDGPQNSGHTLPRRFVYEPEWKRLGRWWRERRAHISDVSAEAVRSKLCDQSMDGRQCAPVVAGTGCVAMGAAAFCAFPGGACLVGRSAAGVTGYGLYRQRRPGTEWHGSAEQLSPSG